MELPLYVWRPRSTVPRRQGRPLGEMIRDWAAWIAGGAREGASASSYT